MISVKIKRKTKGRIPQYQSPGSSGADVLASLDEPVMVAPGEIALVPTGLFIELPEGYEAQIRPRSGLAVKYGITLLNTPGTIDADYRGEIKIIIANFGKEPFRIDDGMRIAQMVFCRVFRGNFIEVEALKGTERDNGGFGHTGI